MAGPLIEVVRSLVDEDKEPTTVREQMRDDMVLENHREEMNRAMKDSGDGGGCCNAASVATAVRRNGKEYR